MAELLASDDTYADGTLVRSVRFYADGTVTVEENGEVVESRPQTADEAARFAPPLPSADERLEVLVGALAKATTLAQVRAAAQAAAG